MKPVFVALLLAATTATQAQQVSVSSATAGSSAPVKAPPSSTVAARAERLSNQMIHDLHLNGYQAGQLRLINSDKVAKLDAAERQYAANPQALEAQSKKIAKESDQTLQAMLTTDQYTDYFDARKRYAQVDRDYARSASSANLINSVQNPSPVRANDATIGPAKTNTKTAPRQSAEPFGRTLRH